MADKPKQKIKVMAFTVAIIGRPNVGKSTIFNRLIGKKLAIVDNTPGVTRDRHMHIARLQHLSFDVIDTAGLEEPGNSILKENLRAQTQRAIEEADLILFVFDASVGMVPADSTFASIVRKAGKPIVLVANKSDKRHHDESIYDSWQLGLGAPCAISAAHGQGLDDLRDAIIKTIGEEKAFEGHAEKQPVTAERVSASDNDAETEESLYDTTQPLRLAIVGRPNVGKSTLVNTMLGQERLLTGPEAGITRDSIAVDWIWRDRKIQLYDTAGLRRKAQVHQKLEKLAVIETLRVIRFAEVVIIVLDATAPFEKQNLQITDLVVREGRALIIVFNKWDLIKKSQKKIIRLYQKYESLFPQIRGVRMLPISGKSIQDIDCLMENVETVHGLWNRRFSTSQLNRWLERMVALHPLPAISGRHLKLKYITQIKVRPPGFMIYCSRPDIIPTSYLRYLVNGLRQDFNIPGIPIRIFMRKTANPFISVH
ncbi:MAG: GTP-binding protein [Candidatus Tokpelaia sp. JSC085]|nr:MAG: GTP-binding protein [Candidatus Tokpelaia sp. JSC085]